MSYVEELGLATAEQLERTVGSWIALASFERLLAIRKERLSTKLEARALCGAMRCALSLGDTDKTLTFLERYKSLPANLDEPAFRDLLRKTAVNGPKGMATRLSQAEAERRPTGVSLFMWGRSLEVEGNFDPRPYAAAARCDDIPAAIRLRAAALVAQDACARFDRDGLVPTARQFAIDVVRSVQLADLSENLSERLAIARVLMWSTSAFERAQGLSILCDILRSTIAADEDRSEALYHVAAHVDAWGSRLHPVERDRSLTAVTAAQSPLREILVAQFKSVVTMPAADAAESVKSSYLATVHANNSAAVAVASERDVNAQAVARVELALSPGRIPANSFHIVLAAMRSADRAIGREACRMLPRLMRLSLAPPPFGYSALAIATALFDEELSIELYRQAYQWREPQACLGLVLALKRASYRALDRGQEAEALQLLSEAKKTSQISSE